MPSCRQQTRQETCHWIHRQSVLFTLMEFFMCSPNQSWVCVHVPDPDSVGVFGVVFQASVGLSGSWAMKHKVSIPHNFSEQIRAPRGRFHSWFRLYITRRWRLNHSDSGVYQERDSAGQPAWSPFRWISWDVHQHSNNTHTFTHTPISGTTGSSLNWSLHSRSSQSPQCDVHQISEEHLPN